MRDQRLLITDSVLMILVKHEVNQEVINEVRTRLEVELAKYEVYKRCTNIIPIDPTPFDYLRQFLEVKCIEGKSQGTIKRYYYEIGKLLRDCRKPLKEITTNDLRLYLDYRKKNGKRELSNRTLENMRNCYSTFFKWLTEEHIIEWNPCSSLHQIKYRKMVRKTYSQVEIQKLREACKDIRDITMIDWFLSTGCRVSEVETSKLSDIDWDEKSIIVTGKGNKDRKVYFDSVTAMHMKKYLATRNDCCDSIFVTSLGKPLTKSGIQQAIKRIGDRAGVTKTYCHRFRHTLATRLVSSMPVTDVATILGHDNINTTQIYCYSDPLKVMANYKREMA